jgi:uncharacterized protein involved in cysteine biosynthesis
MTGNRVGMLKGMLAALLRAIAQLSLPPLQRIAALGLAVSAACFIALWLGVAMLLGRLDLFGWRPLNWLVDLLGAVAVAVLSWLLFPAVVTAVMSLFLDRVAAAVEALDYPGLAPARRVPVGETVMTTARLMVLAVLLNLLALPAYVLVPGVNFFVFLGLNGYLFGREYFEVVALRRLDPAAARATRQRWAGRVFVAGAIIAGIFAVPLVNLVAPLIATAFMVHLFQRLRRSEPHLLGS